MTDDLAVCIPQGKNVILLPSVPRVKLKDDSLSALKYSSEDWQELELRPFKKSLSYKGSWSETEARIKHLVILEKSKKEEFSIKELKGLEKMKALQENFHNLNVAEVLWSKQELFKSVSNLAAKLRVSIVERPESGFQIEGLSDFIETHLG